MKKLFNLILLAVALSFGMGLNLYAQSGYYDAPTLMALQNYGSSSSGAITWQYRVCTNASTGFPCNATVAITSDKAGVNSITQPVTFNPVSGRLTFFAPPGLYYVQYSYAFISGAAGATQSQFFNQPIIVPPDANPTTNSTTAASDNVLYFGPQACGWNATGTLTGTNGATVTGASFVPTVQAQTSNAAGTTNTLTCWIPVPLRLTTGKGATLNDCVISYGIQTTALTSLGAPTINTISLPAPGAGESASTVTPVTAGAVTVTPVVGSANLGTTTAGAFFTEKVALNAPVLFNTDNQVILYQQTFVQSAAAAQIVQTPGGYCHFQNNAF